MKRFILTILVLAIVIPEARADTMADLITKLRYRLSETDTSTSAWTNVQLRSYLNQSQDKVVRMAGFIERSYDVRFSVDSVDYRLPADFKAPMKVRIRHSGLWEMVIRYDRDTNVFSWDYDWKNTDSARLYLRGADVYDDDTIRVNYLAKAIPMNNDSDTCRVSSDLQVHLIEEAFAMCMEAIRSFSVAQALWQQNRLDMGLIKPQEQK